MPKKPDKWHDKPPPSAAEQRNKLSDQERIWVIGLQDAIRQENANAKTSKEDQELFSKVSDFDIALHAILAKDEPAKALHRLRRLVKFKQAYKVHDHTTVYEAIKILDDFVHTYPDFIQSCGKDASGRWVCFFKLEALLTDSPTRTSTGTTTSRIMTVEEKFGALYYVFHALQPDLDAIRNGTVWVGDLDGISIQNLTVSVLNAGRALCRDAYPIKVKDFPCLNSPSRLSAVYVMCRPFLSSHLFEKMVPNCTLLLLRKHFPQRLRNKAYGGTQPAGEILQLLEENLQKRFDNQETFRLNLLGIH